MYTSTRWSLHADPLAGQGHDVAGDDLAAPPGLVAAVDRHLPGLEDLAGGGAVLDQPRELEQLAEADRLVADLDVPDRAPAGPRAVLHAASVQRASLPGSRGPPVVG